MWWRTVFFLWMSVLLGLGTARLYGYQKLSYILQQNRQGGFYDLQIGVYAPGETLETKASLQVSPDGRYAVYVSRSVNGDRLMLSDHETTATTQIASGDLLGSFGQVRWLPGEVRLYNQGPTQQALLAIDLTAPAPRLRLLVDLATTSGVRSVLISPDGNRLMIQRRTQEVEVMAADSGELIFQQQITMDPLSIRWLKSDTLVYIAENCFYALDILTGASSQVACVEARSLGLQLPVPSPNGERVAWRYSLNGSSEELLRVIEMATGAIHTYQLDDEPRFMRETNTLSWSADSRYIYTEVFSRGRMLGEVVDVQRQTVRMLRVSPYGYRWVTPGQFRTLAQR